MTKGARDERERKTTSFANWGVCLWGGREELTKACILTIYFPFLFSVQIWWLNVLFIDEERHSAFPILNSTTSLSFFAAIIYLTIIYLPHPRFVYIGSYPRSNPQTLLSWGVRLLYFFFHDLSFYLSLFFKINVFSFNCLYSLCLLLRVPFSLVVLSSYILRLFSTNTSDQFRWVESVYPAFSRSCFPLFLPISYLSIFRLTVCWSTNYCCALTLPSYLLQFIIVLV